MKNLFFVLLIFCFFISLNLLGKIKYSTTTNKTIGLIERMDVNNIDLALENNGATANDGQMYYPNGQTVNSLLFQGGFFITAYVNGELRSSSMASSSLIEEWQPGIWGMDPNDPLAKFYVVNSSNVQGSQPYIDWSNAVSLGAEFQDLNEDGFYDPYVDRPDMLGDRIIWFPLNDSTLLSQRIRFNTLPIGLEIHASAWAFARTDELGDVIFFRYRIINATDTVKNDVLVSMWADPDIGDCDDDLLGSDSTLSLGYCYNDFDDPLYGANPPAYGIQLLQGPIVPSLGDTAYNFRGSFFGIDTLYDYKNSSMTSFMWYMSGHPIISNPATVQTARYYQIGGLDGLGNPLDPTYWGTGGTISTNPKFAFSGDPVSGNGWRDNAPDDKRFMISFGAFDLGLGQEQDIIIAYIVGQGNNALESVILLKNRAAILKGLYPISGISNEKSKHPQQITLYQNYPNPFNPKTTIKYELPQSTDIRIEIFNILGQSVKTLINGKQNRGIHTISWNGLNETGKQVSSGIYFYSLQTENFVKTKKMLLIR